MTGVNSVAILLPAGIRQDMKFKLLRRRVAESMQLLVLLTEQKLWLTRSHPTLKPLLPLPHTPIKNPPLQPPQLLLPFPNPPPPQPPSRAECKPTSKTKERPGKTSRSKEKLPSRLCTSSLALSCWLLGFCTLTIKLIRRSKPRSREKRELKVSSMASLLRKLSLTSWLDLWTMKTTSLTPTPDSTSRQASKPNLLTTTNANPKARTLRIYPTMISLLWPSISNE